MWREELLGLLDRIGPASAIMPTAYDTAWVASVPHPGDYTRPAFPAALEWLYGAQLADGSWGADTLYYHDRILSTLRAAVTLARWMKDRQTRKQLVSAQRAIWYYLSGLRRDAYATVGFELILPTLLREARALGLHLPYSSFDHYARIRQAKLAKIPPALLYSPRMPTTFSLEFMGGELDGARARDLQAENGSIAASPSATAYYLVQMPGNAPAREYLRGLLQAHDGGAPAVAPIDVFETAWVLYNILLACPDARALAGRAQPHVQRLLSVWQPGGAAHNHLSFEPDLDDTALVYWVLGRLGVQLDAGVFLRYAEESWFRCYPYESEPSISANIHMLEAVRAPWVRLENKAAVLEKLLAFLSHARTLQTFWFDKWHASPYYTTAHAVLALWGDLENSALAADALYWIANTQNPNGSWGFYHDGSGTAEETAYSLQALLAYRRAGGDVDRGIIERGAAFLADSQERKTLHYRPLWISKMLYSPTYVVHSAVLSALAMYEDLC